MSYPSPAACENIVRKNRAKFVTLIVKKEMVEILLNAMPHVNEMRAISMKTLAVREPGNAADQLLDCVGAQEIWEEFIPALQKYIPELGALFS